MEEILKYLSLITLAGTAISFAVGLIKWIDQRNREQEQKQYEAFHKMVCIASGTDESGRTVKMVQQIAAIYQLQAYKQYAFASVPVLELMKFEYSKSNQDERAEHMFNALNETLQSLKHENRSQS
jgi:hypothetical protein